MRITKSEISDYKLAKGLFINIEGEPYNHFDKEDGYYYYFTYEVQHKYTSGYYDLWNDNNNKIHLQSKSTGAEIVLSNNLVGWNSILKAMNKSGLQAPKWFDPTDYLMANRDLFDKLLDPVEHYLNHGIREGRNPSPFFSEKKYLELNPDVKAAIQNKAIVDGSPLISGYMHYMEYGCREGRSPDGVFDEQKYLDLHQDLAQHKVTGGIKCGFLHCIYDGLAEGRLGCADVYPEY